MGPSWEWVCTPLAPIYFISPTCPPAHARPYPSSSCPPLPLSAIGSAIASSSVNYKPKFAALLSQDQASWHKVAAKAVPALSADLHDVGVCLIRGGVRVMGLYTPVGGSLIPCALFF